MTSSVWGGWQIHHYIGAHVAPLLCHPSARSGHQSQGHSTIHGTRQSGDYHGLLSSDPKGGRGRLCDHRRFDERIRPWQHLSRSCAIMARSMCSVFGDNMPAHHPRSLMPSSTAEPSIMVRRFFGAIAARAIPYFIVAATGIAPTVRDIKPASGWPSGSNPCDIAGMPGIFASFALLL